MTAPVPIGPQHRGALERAIANFRRHADELGPFNHDAEFPESDAEALRQVVAYIAATESPNDFLAGWLAGHAAGRAGEAALVAMLQARLERLERGAELPATATEALRKVASLNENAAEIGAGMLRTIVQLSRAALAERDRRAVR